MSEREGLTTTRVGPLRLALLLLVSGERAGICADNFGEHCLYCAFRRDDYGPPYTHDPYCPIEMGRAALLEAQE